MVDAEIIREWLTKADEDFGFARINYEEQSSFFAQICFHFQQSAEKYLKAYIIAHQLTFRKEKLQLWYAIFLIFPFFSSPVEA